MSTGGGGGGGFLLARAFVDFTTRGFSTVMSQIDAIRRALSSLPAMPMALGVPGGGFGMINVSSIVQAINALHGSLRRLPVAADAAGSSFSSLRSTLLGVVSGFSAIGLAVPGLRMASLAISLLTTSTMGLGGAITFATAGLNLLVAGAAVLVGTVIGVGAASAKAAVDMQVLDAGFTTLLGSASKAKAMVSSLADFAAKTPLELPEISEAGKVLLAAKVPAGELVNTLRVLGDIGMPLNIPLQEMAMLIARNRNAVHVYTRDLNELTTRGVDIVGALAAKFGVTRDEIMKMTTAGKIQFDDVWQAMVKMTQQGGAFAGGMERASRTVEGLASTMRDAFGAIGRALGRPLIEPLSAAIKMVTFLASMAGELLETLLPAGSTGETLFTRMNKQLDLMIANVKLFVDMLVEGMAQALESIDKSLRASGALVGGFATSFADDLGLSEVAEGLRQLRRERNAQEKIPPGGEPGAGGPEETPKEGKFAFLDLTSFTKRLQEGLEKDVTAKKTEENTRKAADALADIMNGGLKVSMGFA